MTPLNNYPDLSGVASEIGGFGDGGSTAALEESPSVPGMSSLATFDNDDFYSQVDLPQQVPKQTQFMFSCL